MALDPSIALGVRPLQLPDPLAQMAQVSQIKAGQQQQQLNQMKIEELVADRKELNDFALKLKDQGITPRQYMEMLRSSRDPVRQKTGVEGLMRLDEQDKFERVGKGLYPELFGAAPAAAPAAAPTGAPAPSMMRQPAVAPVAPTQDMLGTGMYGMQPTNALAPTAPQAAPVNALAPTAAPAGKSVDQLRREIIMFSQSTDPRAKAMADMLKNQLTELSKTQTLAPGQQLYAGGKVIYTAPEKDSEFEKLLTKSGLSDTEKTALRLARAKKEATHAPGTSVYMPPQEKAFESELGKGQAEGLIKGKVAAQDAASIIDTVKTGRDIMKSGMITGAGADFLVNLNQGLKTAGIDAGYGDAAANSQAFTANMAGNVGKLIKQFGAGTGLSDADREFAKDMAGGRIALDAKAINKILDINERAARNVITRHNKDVKGIKTNIPLEVEMPPEFKAPAASNVVTNPQFPGFSIGK
jgi:hypothetical protein